MQDRPQGAPTTKGLAFLGAVAGGLVHEIRNPLSTMNVTLQLLQEEYPEPGDDDLGRRTSRRLATLRGEVSRLEAILDDFLRYAGIRRLNLSSADLNRVLEEVTAFIRPECARADIELAFFPDRALPLMPLDERLVKQALLNLFLNAIQAFESAPDTREASGSSSSAEAGRERRLIVRVAVEGEFARVDVIDTGPGIPDAIQARIFEVYFSAKRSGSGLGLPTARRVAEEHGGSLQFETEPGRGTDFILRLPLAGPIGPDATDGGGS